MTVDSSVPRYTDDLFSGFPVGGGAGSYSPYYGNGVVVRKQYPDGIGQSTDGDATGSKVLSGSVGSRAQPTVCYAGGDTWGVSTVSGSTWTLYESTNGAASFTAVGTVNGNGGSLAYVEPK